jgi:acyl-CoA reductase-like NAD-dependent aldehyde dehydrogenase
VASCREKFDGSGNEQGGCGPFRQAYADADRRKLGEQRFQRRNSRRKPRQSPVPRGGTEDIDRAVQAAHKAFAGWSRVIPRERGRALQKIADAVEARVEELAKIVAEETGNAIRTQARPEAKGAADILRYFGGLASELKGETIPTAASSSRASAASSRSKVCSTASPRRRT